MHDDLENAVDKYLDAVPFPVSWRRREGDESVRATPLVGCRQQGSAVGFAYAKLARGDSLVPSGEGGIHFGATDPTSGQRLWTEVAPSVYERTRSAGGATFTFGAAAGQAMPMTT